MRLGWGLVSAPALRVVPSTGHWLPAQPAEGGEPRAAARVGSGTNELGRSSSWDPAQGLQLWAIPQCPGAAVLQTGSQPAVSGRPRGPARTRRAEETHPAFVSAEHLSIVKLHVYCGSCRGEMEKIEFYTVLLFPETF